MDNRSPWYCHGLRLLLLGRDWLPARSRRSEELGTTYIIFEEQDGYILSWQQNNTPMWLSRSCGFHFPFERDALAEMFQQINVAVAPLIIAVSPVMIIVGLYSFMTFGFSVILNILLTFFLQTPVAKGGYGFSPLQNAACECLKHLLSSRSLSRKLTAALSHLQRLDGNHCRSGCGMVNR